MPVTMPAAIRSSLPTSPDISVKRAAPSVTSAIVRTPAGHAAQLPLQPHEGAEAGRQQQLGDDL